MPNPILTALAERCEGANDLADLVAMGTDWLKARIAEESPRCEGTVLGRFIVHRFRDGEDVGLPKWARHLVLGGYGGQGWAAFDQRQGGVSIASGRWGDPLLRLRGGRVTSRSRRDCLSKMRKALGSLADGGERG